MNIKDAQYMKDIEGKKIDLIKATVDDKVWFIPLAEGNRYYAEIMKQVKAGTLTIKDAD